MSTKTYFKDLNSIINSKDFRNLQDKTQLFYSQTGEHYRTRLTHSIEVRNIAQEITYLINNYLENENKDKNLLLDSILVDAIALSHDIGHTPFGHIGERVIEDILSRNDDLGGLLNKENSNKLFFKHNANSMRIIYEIDPNISWQIIDGVGKHTSIYKKNKDYGSVDSDPYKISKYVSNSIKSSLDKDYLKFQTPLSLEGQVVRVADEIAQRVSDIDDGFETRFISEITDILDIDENKEKVEDYIRREFVQDVVDNFRDICETKGINYSTIKRGTIFEKCFMDLRRFNEKNSKLDQVILTQLARSENVRVSDSRSKYIIRQLFKAYIKDIKLVPDNVIKTYFKKIGTIKKDSLRTEKNLLPINLSGNLLKRYKKYLMKFTLSQEEKDELSCKKFSNKDLYDIIYLVNQEKWLISENGKKKTREIIDFEYVEIFYDLMLFNEQHQDLSQINKYFDQYLNLVGNYIASMTDGMAKQQFNLIYGN